MKFLNWLAIGALLLAGGFVGGTAIVASNDKATEFVYEKICKVGEADREELVKNKELIKTLQDSNTAKATQIDEYKDTVDSLTAEKTALENTVATTQEELEAKEIAIADKEAQINDYLTRIETLETEIDSNEKTIAELEEYNAQAQKDVDDMVITSAGYQDNYAFIFYENETPHYVDLYKGSTPEVSYVNDLVGRELFVNQVVRYKEYTVCKDEQNVGFQFLDKIFDIAENATATIECYVNGQLTTDLSSVMQNSGHYITSLDFENNLNENNQVTSVTIKVNYDLFIYTLENGCIESVVVTNSTDGSVLDELVNVEFDVRNCWLTFNELGSVDYDRVVTLTTFDGKVYTGIVYSSGTTNGITLTLSE